jgi:hypothetical protein
LGRGRPFTHLAALTTLSRSEGERLGPIQLKAPLSHCGRGGPSPKDRAKLVVMTPEDLAELIEDPAATAAYHRTRDQERVPIGAVDLDDLT